jgi:hypothetical protein
MPAAYANLYLEQGTTFATTIEIDDVYGSNYDLTGVSASRTISKSYYTSCPTATFATNVNANTSTITLSLSAAATSNIAAGRYVYDTTITNSDQEVTRILEGIVDVSPRVTR